MHSRPHPSLWQRLVQRATRRPAREAPDAADLGTAFGLDCVLDDAPPPPKAPQIGRAHV